MAKAVPLKDPTNYRRVHERIKALWETGNFIPHAEGRMRTRKLEVTDIQHVIKTGRIVEHSKPGELWRYKIEGLSVDGKKIACVVEINDALEVIAVMRGK